MELSELKTRIKAVNLRLLRETSIDRDSDVDSDVVVSESINAFAFETDGDRIRFTTALLQRYADDDIVIMAIMGHEDGHLKLNHLQQEINYAKPVIHAVTGFGVGVALGMINPILITTSFGGIVSAFISANREKIKLSHRKEFEADEYAARLGVQFLDGLIRFFNDIIMTEGDGGSDTHPSFARRIEALEKLKNSIY